MLRRAQQRGRAILFNASSVLHHRDAVGQLSHNTQVVRDKQQAHVQLVTQFPQQRQYLRLYRHVQRRCGLVGNQQLGSREQGHSDHHALAFAAGELMWKIIQPFGRVAYARSFQTVQNFSPRGLFAHPPVQGEHFIELFLQAVQRVEGNHRLLEDHRDFVAANTAQGMFVGMKQ